MAYEDIKNKNFTQGRDNVSKKSDDKLDNTKDIRGELDYEDKVIQKIVGMALNDVDGLLAVEGGFFSNLTGKIVNTDDVTKGVDVEVGQTQVAVDLKVITEYRKNIPEIYDEIKNIIVKEVSQMTNLEVVEINVTVSDIKTKDQQKQDEESLQDKMSKAAKSTSDKAKEVKDDTKEKIEKKDNSRVD